MRRAKEGSTPSLLSVFRSLGWWGATGRTLLFLVIGFLFFASDAFASSLWSLDGWGELGLRGWDFFQRGGVVMYPILFCSVLGLGVALERLFSLRRGRVIREDFLADVRRRWEKGDVEGALEVCRSFDISIARVLRAGLQLRGHPLADIERAIEAIGQHEVSLLTSHLRALGFLANVAPMLGFLGTVTGMLQAFNAISHSERVTPGLVAAGISEALITTVAGLVVGIPCLAAYHYFRGRVDGYVYEMEAIALDLLEGLARRAVGGPEEARAQGA